MVYYIVHNSITMIWESNILLKFLFGKCSKQEATEVQTWLAESEYNQNTLTYLRSTVGAQLK